MAAERFAFPQQNGFTAFCILRPGWKIYFSKVGASEPQPVFADPGLLLPHSSPVMLDRNGQLPDVYLDADLDYAISVRDEFGIERHKIDFFRWPHTTAKLFQVGVSVQSGSALPLYQPGVIKVGVAHESGYALPVGTRPPIVVLVGVASEIGGALPVITGRGDPSWNSVALLLPFDTDTALGDVSPAGHDVGVFGAASLSTAQHQTGGASLSLNGSTGYLLIDDKPIDLGPGNFTFECFIRATATGASRVVFSVVGDGGTLNMYWYGSSNSMALYSTLGNTRFLTSSQTLSANTWYHVAFVRQGNTFRIFIDGVLRGTGTNTVSLPNARVFIGSNGGTQQFFAGFIDEVRVTQGVARYTSNFTPPTQSFPRM